MKECDVGRCSLSLLLLTLFERDIRLSLQSVVIRGAPSALYVAGMVTITSCLRAIPVCIIIS